LKLFVFEQVNERVEAAVDVAEHDTCVCENTVWVDWPRINGNHKHEHLLWCHADDEEYDNGRQNFQDVLPNGARMGMMPQL